MKLTTLKSTNVKYNKLYLKNLLFLLGIVCFSSTTANAQLASNYTLTQHQITSQPPSTDYSPLSASKTILQATPWNDEAATSINLTGLSFVFKFNNTTQTTVWVSPNGFVSFGAAPATINYTPLATLGTTTGVIAAYAGNLKSGTTSVGVAANAISYEMDSSGGAGNKILKIEWANFLKNITTESQQMSMQLWLYENNNVIETRYQTVGGPFAATSNYNIGLRGATTGTTDVLALSFPTNAIWPNTSMTVSNNNTATVRTVTTLAAIDAGSNRLFRWTPLSCTAPSVSVSNVAITSATGTFTSGSSTNFQYVLSNSNTAPTGAGTSCTSPLSLTSLSASTQYYLWVRTDCGAGGFSSWTSSGAFTTLCTALNVPYTQNFNSVSSGIPACTAVQQMGSGNQWSVVTSPPDTNSSGYSSNYLMYSQSGTNAANTWFYTEGINLTAGKSYKLSYFYGGTSVPTTIINKMEVKYGLAPNAVSMTLPLDDHPVIKGSGNSNDVIFTATSSAVYYFGFRAYSSAAQGNLFLEDITIVATDCVKPTSVTASSVTSTTASISWTQPPSPPLPSYPAYSYYITTTSPMVTAGSFVVGTQYEIQSIGTTDFTSIGASSNTVGVLFVATGVGTGTGTAATIPSNNTVATANVANGVPGVNLTSLANATTYYIWVRSSCGSGEFSAWSALCSFTTLNTPPYCIPSSTRSTSYFSNFKTTGGFANINNFSSYALPSGYADYSSQIVSQSAGNSINFSTTIVGPTVGVAIWVDWNQNNVFDAGERMYNTGAYVSNASGSFAVPGGQAIGLYRMRIVMDYWATSASPCSITLSSGYRRGEVEDYTFQVVTPPPSLTLSQSSTSQCVNTNSPTITLTAGGSSYTTYTWSPATGVTGNTSSGWVFTNSATTVYTLNAIQTSSPFATNTVSYTYIANSPPSAVLITPATADSCQGGSPVLLTASGGTVPNSVALTENFESGATTWTRGNNCGASIFPPNTSPAPEPAWTIRSNGYNRPPQFTSNDSSSFILSDSDAQGQGTTTAVYLDSPVFSLANYSSATLSFWHYYRSWSSSTAQVQLSTDGGTTWSITLQTYTTTTQGSASGFVNASLDLSSYVNQTNLKVRFKYDASWGYYWAIDNVLVSGTKNPQFVWTPTTGLYTNAAGTVPYVANAITSTVYALPTTTTTYTATTSSASNCSNSNTVVVTYYPQAVAGVASSNQSNCDPAAFTAIALAGPTLGSVVRWEYADDSAFTTNVTTITNNTSILPTSQFGVFTGSRYFRAVVANGTCTNVYSNVVTLSTTGTTWNGGWSNGNPDITKSVAFASNYTVTADMSACSIQVAAGVSVTVNPGVTITVQNGVTLSSPALATALVFENNSSLLQVNNTTNVGSIVYKRNTTPLVKYDFTYWSSPVSPFTLFQLSPNTNNSEGLFKYNPLIPNWQLLPSNTAMDAGVGYIVRVPDSTTTNPLAAVPYTASFFGVPNNGTYTTTIVGGQVNLIGNPYPSAISAVSLVDDSANSSVLGGTLYFWTHNTPLAANVFVYNDYALWNKLGGTGTRAALNSGVNNSIPDGTIAAGQSFFIAGQTTGSATFKNTMRLSSGNDRFYRTASESNSSPTIERHRIWLDISNTQGAYKQILIGYVAGGTMGIDRSFDAEVFDVGNPIMLFSLVDAKKLSIQGRGLTFSENDTVTLGYKSTSNGEFSVSLSNFDGLFMSQNIYLEDKLLNVIYDLKAGPYTFSTLAGTFEERFVLRFTNQALGVPVFSENTLVVYKNEEGLHVNSGTIPMQSVAIYDITGRLIVSKNAINDVQTKFTTLPATNQVLLVQITSETGIKVTKKVLY